MDEDDAPGLVGLPVETATQRVVETEGHDSRRVREQLTEISEDGTITRAAVEDALADLSKVVATPETRIEIARRALSDAREAATPVSDTDHIASRLREFEATLSALEERVDALGTRLSSLVEQSRDPDDLYAVAESIKELRAGALDAQRGADSLAVEIEEFERTLRRPDEWADELHEDIDAAEQSMEELLDAADSLSDAANDSADGGNPARRWADLSVQQRTQRLVVDDIGAERDALEQMAAHAGIDDVGDGIETRLDELDALCAEVGHRLDEVSEPSWRHAHDETIRSFARTVAEFEPPIDWERLQAEVETYHQRIADSE